MVRLAGDNDMNPGLLHKKMREVMLPTVLFALGLALIQGLLGYVMPLFFDQFAQHVIQVPFVRTLFKGIIGVDLGGAVDARVIHALSFAHPLVIAIVWAHAISLCTRLPAGEIDRGTIDVLLSLPISRTTLFIHDWVLCLASGLIVLAIGFATNRLGSLFLEPAARIPAADLWRVVVNLFALFVAVAGLASLVSAWCSNRGAAVGLVTGYVLVAYLVNFLANLWPPANRVAFLSVMQYYSPHRLIASPAGFHADLLVLVIVGLVGAALGTILFARRDILTV